MLTFLSDIWNSIRDIPFLLAGFMVDIVNGIIVAIAAVATTVLALLPAFPDPPSAPSGVLGALVWVVPLGTILSGFSVLVALWVTFLGIKVALNWVKAL